MGSWKKGGALAVVAIAAVGVVAGCGGSDDSDSANAESTAAETVEDATVVAESGDFVAELEAVCAEGTAASEAVATPETPDDYYVYLTSIIPIGTDMVSQIEAIEVPEENAADVEALVAAINGQLEAFQTAADSIDAGEDPEAALAAVEADGQAAEDEATAIAEELGAPSCGKTDDSEDASATEEG